MSLDQIAGRFAYNEDHEAFRQTVRSFLAKEGVPNADQWEKDRLVPKAFWQKAGEVGMLCPTVPEAYGGLGLDFGYNAIVDEEMAYSGVPAGFSLQSDIVAGYMETYGSEEQKKEWLPKMVSGDVITAIAMTEPGTGSDLQSIRTTARKDGNHYVINGSKTYITNGQNTDLTLVVAKTDPDAQPAYKGMSIILVESDREGFSKGRKLDKIGQDAADTSELFFEDVRVPITNCLGEEGMGFIYLMSQLPQERLSIAVSTMASSQKAFDDTVAFVKERKAFKGTVFDFQNTKFVLADLKAKLQVGWAHLDWAIARHLKGELTNEEGAAAKLWHTDLQWEVMDKCLQLHGGAGYMNEYPIARMWRGARVSRIYGGTNEIMKEVIGRKL
ncbi:MULTISPECIES: acyl-CoA dehydrogenase family protein [unclassified Sphingomonas]|uniref:acyl-CoA dehydrogenase family protein n=1 Tax=unclassified Sphingomonas TaxID=196159 RepID=UPI001D125CEB|nr:MULTISPECIES: acyl-CoA dehydrogenase family protein [unclassified Sphingomonas]MCC2981637.1 acyl-CoA dehydrogenase family protein [Sphingomonas sp. IC4-52]MCD2316635.1 acyl-CoA dehydrogenase family protein [Sphingomonas sp. IC-11]